MCEVQASIVNSAERLMIYLMLCMFAVVGSRVFCIVLNSPCLKACGPSFPFKAQCHSVVRPSMDLWSCSTDSLRSLNMLAMITLFSVASICNDKC